jgi:hypothetical protein
MPRSESPVQCHMLLDDDTQCPDEALWPDSETLMCAGHLAMVAAPYLAAEAAEALGGPPAPPFPREES